MAEAPTADCERYREDLSAFADDTLSSRRWEQVGYHVAGCPRCRAELADIRRVRHSLGEPDHVPADATLSLTERLQGIAGDHVHAPLYMASGGPSCALPSRRRARRKRMLHSGITVLAVLASVMLIAFLIAPEPHAIGSSVKQAREQFALSATAVSVNEAVGAVLFAHERGASFGESQHQSPRFTMASEPQALSRVDAAAMLESEGPTHSGTQRVWISAGGDGFHAADVRVDEVSGEGSSLVVFDAAGQRFVSWFVPSSPCCEMTDGPPWSFWLYTGMDQVADRWAHVVEARDDAGRRVARWWVDSGNGLILWSERYGPDGVPTIISGYTDLKLGEAHLAEDGVELVSMSPVSSSGAKGWCMGLPHCPSTMAGLPLVAHASSGTPGERSMRLFYTDGFRGLSVLWVEGLLQGTTSITGHNVGFPEVSVWQSGDAIVSVATNGSMELLQEASAQLPGHRPWEPSVFDRIGRGLARLVGIN